MAGAFDDSTREANKSYLTSLYAALLKGVVLKTMLSTTPFEFMYQITVEFNQSNKLVLNIIYFLEMIYIQFLDSF